MNKKKDFFPGNGLGKKLVPRKLKNKIILANHSEKQWQCLKIDGIPGSNLPNIPNSFCCCLEKYDFSEKKNSLFRESLSPDCKVVVRQGCVVDHICGHTLLFCAELGGILHHIVQMSLNC